MKDLLITQIDVALRTIFPPPYRKSSRPFPDANIPESMLSPEEQKEIGRLMRVNHAGEVAAQALYSGHALTAKKTETRASMLNAQMEENDHLAWCEKRLREVHAYPSSLNLIWYSGAMVLGAISGLLSDKISFGFVAETERQVLIHIDSHLHRLPKQDQKTEAILLKMKDDEAKHAEMALAAGGISFPNFIEKLMQLTAKVMTYTARYV